MSPRTWRLFVVLASLVAANFAAAGTTITFTRAEVNNMANLWETDCVSISPLANAQYPAIAGTWDFVFPHSSVSSDRDIHVDMAIDSSGTGAHSSSYGASPIICEVINANSALLNHITGLSNQQALFRGIFRFYTEHAFERHFEIHPVTQLQKWNGSTFVFDTDYHSNILAVADGTTHPDSVLTALLDGSQTITATVASDNINVTFQSPSPSVNYCQYDGVTVSEVQSDALSQYFVFRPNLVPGVTVRCRLVANTAAATAAAGLVADQTVTVNALTRTDMAQVASHISSINAGQQMTFARPIELIVLGLPSIGSSPTPTPTATPTPTPTPSSMFSNTASVAITGANGGKGNPYPSTIAISGLVGKITKVTAQLNGIGQSGSSDYASDIDIQMVGPGGQNVMLMSDAGDSQPLARVNLAFDDAAASVLPASTSNIKSGTYKPTNYNNGVDSFPAPAPAASPGTLLSVYNNTNPNGTWSLFVVDSYGPGRGSIAGGWTITINTMASAPFVTTNTASSVASTTATLNGTIDPLGQVSTYQFQLGPDTNYGFTQTIQAASSATPFPAHLNLTGLKPGTTYHFRLVGANNSGTTMGLDRSFTTAAFTDTDGDGMPNDYETANGFSPTNPADGNADADGDGMTNYQEYIAGTNPRSAASVLRVTSVEKAGGDIVITFPSVVGKNYTVQQTNALDGTWLTLTDNLPGTGGALNVTDVEAFDVNQRRFYRVLTD